MDVYKQTLKLHLSKLDCMKVIANTRKGRKQSVLHPTDLLSPFSEKREKAPSGQRKYVLLFYTFVDAEGNQKQCDVFQVEQKAG